MKITRTRKSLEALFTKDVAAGVVFEFAIIAHSGRLFMRATNGTIVDIGSGELYSPGWGGALPVRIVPGRFVEE